MTVGELERRMSERERRDWLRFEALHQPLPDKLADLHSALLLSLIVNMMRSADDAPIRPADFFVIREPDPPPQDGGSEVDRHMAAWRGGS